MTTNSSPSAQLLTFREVYALLGYNSKTAHTALRLAAQGKLKAIRINERVVRYTETSVRALAEGGAK
jgi:hypothetical protein